MIKPPIEEMVKRMGQVKRMVSATESIMAKQSPKGKIYLGPYGAWKVMSGTGTSPEFVSGIVTERP